MDNYHSLLKSCLSLIDEGAFETAIMQAHLMIDAYEESDIKGEIYDIFQNIEKIYTNTPNAIMYFTYMTRLIDILEAENRLDDMVHTMYYLAISYVASKHFEDAEIILNNGLQIAKAQNHYDAQADFMNGYGNILELQDNNEEALKYYLTALNMSKEHGYEEGQRFGHNIGFVYKKMGKYSKAIHYLTQCMTYLESADMPGRLANCCNELGNTYTLASLYEQALKVLKKGEKLSKETHSQSFLMENYLFQSMVFEGLKDYEQSLAYYKHYTALHEHMNIERYNREVASMKLESEINSKAEENEIIKDNNMKLEAYSKALKQSNQALLDSINEQREMQKKIIQTEKSASYNRMMIGISHQVNTALSNIKLMSKQMLNQIASINKSFEADTLTRSQLQTCIHTIHEGATIIENSTQGISRFIERLKSVNISIEEMTESGSFYDLIEDCIKGHETQIKAMHCKVNAQLQDDIPDVSGYNIFKRLINQLLDNALKYAFKPSDENLITIDIRYNTTGKLLIKFQDNGKGIEKALVHRIFDPFYTTNMGNAGGAGMGLYVLQRTVEDILDGQIQCESSPNKGTTFTIELTNRILEI